MPGTVAQVHGHLEVRLFEHIKFNQLVELFEIRGLRIERRTLIRADDRAFERPALRVEAGNVRLDLPGDLRRGRRAVARGKLQALILRWIVTGGHVDAADGFAMADAVGDDGGGRVAIAQERFESAGSEHFGSGQGKFASKKPRVVAENDG